MAPGWRGPDALGPEFSPHRGNNTAHLCKNPKDRHCLFPSLLLFKSHLPRPLGCYPFINAVGDQRIKWGSSLAPAPSSCLYPLRNPILNCAWPGWGQEWMGQVRDECGSRWVWEVSAGISQTSCLGFRQVWGRRELVEMAQESPSTTLSTHLS